MQIRNFYSIIAAIILLGIAIYSIYITERYVNATIWVLLIPIVLSTHPVFRSNAGELKMNEIAFQRLKKILNVSRFVFFTIGILKFLYQFVSDFF